MRKWNCVEVDGRVWVPFLWRDPTPGGRNLGRAEFHVCVKYRRGKVSEMWVYPVQSHITDYWHIVGEYDDFTVSCLEHLERTGAWLVFWCKEHKCPCLSIYAPPNAQFLEIEPGRLTFWVSNFAPDGCLVAPQSDKSPAGE